MPSPIKSGVVISLTTRGMIQYVLFANRGEYFSVSQLQEKIRADFHTLILPETINKAIQEMNVSLCGDLLEKVDRVGLKKQPVKFYSIIKN